jgi:hypothetical protein
MRVQGYAINGETGSPGVSGRSRWTDRQSAGFPRLSAVAETGWTDLKAKSWDRFKALFGMMPVLYGKT